MIQHYLKVIHNRTHLCYQVPHPRRLWISLRTLWPFEFDRVEHNYRHGFSIICSQINQSIPALTLFRWCLPRLIVSTTQLCHAWRGVVTFGFCSNPRAPLQPSQYFFCIAVAALRAVICICTNDWRLFSSLSSCDWVFFASLAAFFAAIATATSRNPPWPRGPILKAWLKMLMLSIGSGF